MLRYLSRYTRRDRHLKPPPHATDHASVTDGPGRWKICRGSPRLDKSAAFSCTYCQGNSAASVMDGSWQWFSTLCAVICPAMLVR